MRPVRLADTALDDIIAQVPAGLLDQFRRYDLARALHLLAATARLDDHLVEHGPVYRATLDGVTVAAFHLFLTPDEVDPREGSYVVVAIDIWLTGIPD